MKCRPYPDVQMVEGTTRHLSVTVVKRDGTPENLVGYRALLTTTFGKKETLKECDIFDNEVMGVIDAEESLGATMGRYEIRIFKENPNEVYCVIQGAIHLTKSIHPYLEMPEII